MDWTRILSQVAGEIIAPTTAAYALAAIGLNIHFGMTGLLNFGQAGFMLLGAYSFAIATIAGWPLWAAVLIALASAVVFALILGIPTLKLRGDYLAIVTIAAAEILRLVARSTSMTRITGGNAGLAEGYKETFEDLSPFPDGSLALGPFNYSLNASNSWWLRIVGWIVVGVGCYLVWRWMRSPWGRVLKGIREDEDAVRSLGKNVYSYKMQSLVIGGIMGGLGGAVFALPSAVVPASYTTSLTFFLWTILLLGGAATVFGPALGAVIFWVLMAFLEGVLPSLASQGILPMSAIQAGQLRFVIVGAALMLLVIFR